MDDAWRMNQAHVHTEKGTREVLRKLENILCVTPHVIHGLGHPGWILAALVEAIGRPLG